MSEYKRFTERDEFGNADIIGVDSAALQYNLLYEEFNRVTNALNRLAELEDKIESGTLVEENKFYIKKSYRNHDDQRYRIVEFIENEYCDGLTLEQAEARLKELQEGKR